MAVVLEYQPGKPAIPEVRMEIDRRRLPEEQQVNKRVTLQLTGVHQPNSFNLRCTDEATDKG